MKWRLVYKEINRLAAEKVLEQQDFYTFEEAWSTLSRSLDSTWNVMDRKNLEFVLQNVNKLVAAYRNQDMVTLERVLPQQNQLPVRLS